MSETALALSPPRLLYPSGAREYLAAVAGMTVSELLADMPEHLRPLLHVWINGTPCNDWDGYRMQVGDEVLVAIVPGGGKARQIFAAVLTIIVAIVAPYIAGAYYAVGTTAYYAATAAITMIGTMAINALIPPPSINTGTQAGVAGPASTYSLAGQSNSSRPFGACIVLYGRHKVMPVLANNIDVSNVGTSSVLSGLYDFGLGWVNLADIRIGDSPVEFYGAELRLHQNSLCTDLTIAGQNIGYDQYAIAMEKDVWVTVRTKAQTIWATLVINFPRGVFQVLTRTGNAPWQADFSAEWRKVGASTWNLVPPDAYIGGDTGYSQEKTPGLQWKDPNTLLWRNYIPPDSGMEIQVAYFTYWGHWFESKDPWVEPVNEWQSVGGFVFDETLYRTRYPDVDQLIKQGKWASGWAHFKDGPGKGEGRDPYPVGNEAQTAVRVALVHVGPYSININFQFEVPGDYEIRVRRLDQIDDGTDNTLMATTKGEVSARYNESSVVLLKSGTYGLPVKPRLRHTMLEMRVTASEQLTGVVQNLSAIATSVLRTTADGATFTYAETRNPAWIAIDILTSERNPKPLADSQIDWPSWVHLAQVCDTPRTFSVNGTPYTGPRYTCDTVVNDATTVKELVESVLASCRSSLTLTSAGKWGVLHDEEKTVPRQVITPANSWGFHGERTFMQKPHALRVAFVNPDRGWQRDETTVYSDGYDVTTATVFETLDTYGITDYPHAWAYGRFMLAQGITRSELFTVTMDVENLLVTRGDLVYVAHDVPLVGGLPTRVQSVGATGAGANGGTLVYSNLPLGKYPTGYCVRTSSGAIRTGRIWSSPAAGAFELDNAAGIAPDDLIVVGDYGTQTDAYLVQRITPGPDLTAQLTLCQYVPAVYSADVGALPEWDSGIGSSFVTGTDLIVTDLTVTQELIYVGRDPRVRVTLAWDTLGSYLRTHSISVLHGDGRRSLVSEDCKPESFVYEVDARTRPDLLGVPLQFEVVPIADLGFRGIPAFVSIVLVGDVTPPGSVAAFGGNVQKEHIDLFWNAPADRDIDYYEVRYSTSTTAPDWEASSLVANVAWPGTKTSVGARTGSYGIRVIDTSGNKSGIVWTRTTVETLPDINIVTILNDRDLVPRWPGVKDALVVNGATLESAGAFGSIAPYGYYYLNALLDLGQIYETRISSKLEAYAVGSPDFSGVSLTPYWDVWLEVRTANNQTMMSDWNPLSSVNPIASVSESQWSGWRPCMVGDFTGQLFQFRIVARSKNPAVRVVITSGRVEVDMPDRLDSYDDVTVPSSGLDFVFPVAFRELQAIAITINGNPDPVVAEVANKAPTGFRVTLTNVKTGLATAGTVDIMAEGYGRKALTSI